MVMATTLWKKKSSLKASRNSTTRYWHRLYKSITQRTPGAWFRNRWFRGTGLFLMDPRVDLVKTKPTHWQSVCLPCLFSPRILDLNLLCAFPHKQWKHGQGAEEAEAWTAPKRTHFTLSSPQTTAEKKLSSWLGAVHHVTWSYFPIPLRHATAVCLPLS